MTKGTGGWTYCSRTGKRGYGSKSAARQASGTMGRKIRVYFCQKCKKYHITKNEGMPRVDQAFFLHFGHDKPRMKRSTRSFYENKPRVDPEELLKALEKKEASK